MEATDYCCPSCDKPLFAQWGNQMFPGNKEYGVTVFCMNGDPSGRSHPQEISGHGNGRNDEIMLKNAYGVLKAKFCGARLENEGELTGVDATEETPAVESPKKGKRKAKSFVPVVEPEDESI